MSPLLTARAGRFVPGALRPADGGGGGGGGESVGFAGGGGGGSPGQSPKHGHYRCYTLLLRYWPREPAHLLRLDPAAFDYWFHQVRSAFLLGDGSSGRSGGRGGSAWSRCCVSEEDSLGLAVTDMLRVTLERRCTCARVLADWLHYVPRRPSRLRRPFLLASLRTHLERLTSSQCNSRQPCIDVNYVKLQYLLKALSLCRERCEERYWVQMVCGDGATGAGPIVLAVDPFHETTPGVRCIRPGQPDHCVCDISDLCYISNLGQCKIELARRCGVPLYLTFSSEMAMQSCVSLLDGWYRLLFKWSFCLNKQLQSPQQLRLRQLRSHGPISSQMAHGKLLARSGSEPGHYLIRQHRQLYRRFIVDLCTCDSAEPVQYDITELPSGMFQWTDSTQYSDTQYESIVAVLIDNNNNNSNNNCSADRAFIQCVFPSEQDEIPMGLFDDANNNASAAADGDLAVTGGGGGGGGGGGCRRMFDQWQQQCFNITAAAAGLSSWYTQRSVAAAAAASSSSTNSHSQPICVLPSALKLVTGRDSEWHGRYCEVQRAQWHRGGSLRQPPLDVAVKRLKHHLAERYLQCYTNSVSECLTWRCESLLAVHGVCLMQSVSLVMEWLPLGALSHYLASHRSQLQLVDLVEAGALLAKALWYLSEQRLTHGQIRCHNVLVAEHTDCRLRVKLADPGLRLVTETDIHWVPVEYFDKLSSSCWSSAADVWAYGTTLWQIFTYGATPLHGENLATAKQLYQIGARLPPPADCPPGVYRLMCECWCREVYNRKAPQAIMRDINQILYDVFNARQSHTYTDLVTSTEQNQSPPSAATATTSDLATQCESVCVSVNELTFSAATPVSHCSWDTDSISSSGVTTATQCQLSHCDLTDSALPPLSQLHLTRIDSPPTQPTSSPPPLSANSTVHPLANQLVRIGKHQMLLPSTDDSAAAAAAAASCLAEQHSRDQLPRVLQLQQSQLRLSEMLGSGFYGEVYKAVLTHSDGGCETVAVKRLKQRTMTQAALDDITREFQILQELRHPHVVSLRGVIAAPQLVLVLEYLCHGSLLACLQSDNGQLGSHQLLQFAADIAQGMEYLGQKNIIHRDLAARNVLVTADYRLKISDFGLAQAASPLTTYYYMKTNRELPFRWYAPESMRYGKFSAKSDVWSYAITLYEIFSLGANPQIPNCDDRQLLETLDRGVRLCCPPRCPVGIYITLMWPCWNETPQLRPSFTELIDSIDQLQQEY